MNSLFASDDFDNPIHYFLDDSLFFDLDPQKEKMANFFVMNNTASLQDDLLQLGQSNDFNYYSI